MMKKWCFLSALLLACSFPAVGYGAAIPGQAYWSFNDGTGGYIDGAYPDPHTFAPAFEEDLPGIPELRITGTNVFKSSASSPASYTTAAGTVVPGGAVLQWERGATGPGSQGNSITLAFDSTGFEDFGFAIQYRLTNGMDGYTFSSIDYSLDNGANYNTTGVTMPVLTANQTWVTTSVDLSSVDAIENQASVLLRFSLPDMPNQSNSFRLNNAEVTSVLVPEPAAIVSIAIGVCALVLVRGRRK